MVRKRSRVRVPPSAPASPQGEPRNTLHKPQGVCFNACGSASARVTRSATTKTPLNSSILCATNARGVPVTHANITFPRHKFTQFRLFFSHCLQGFFHFPELQISIDEIRLAVRKKPIGCQIYCQNSIDFFKNPSPFPGLPKTP